MYLLIYVGLCKSAAAVVACTDENNVSGRSDDGMSCPIIPSRLPSLLFLLDGQAAEIPSFLYHTF